MAWPCDVCGEKLHIKRVNSRNYPTRCPLEKFKTVKSFYTPEFRQKLSSVFYDDFPLSNNPEDLKKFAEHIPEESPISEFIKRYEDKNSKEWTIYTKTLFIEATEESFFTHFTKVLIDIYDDNKIRYIDSPQMATKTQFNYLWLSPTTLKDCYFREGRRDSRFKSMTELGNPSLVIYSLGSVRSANKSWGEIVLDLVTHRASLGKPTWIVRSKPFNSCLEVTTSEELRTYLTRNSSVPTIQLDTDDLLSSNSSSPTTNKSTNSYF